MPTAASSKHVQIADDLRRRIRSRALLPGDALPTQYQLMDAYRVARGTVRQALTQLEHDGLIWSRRGKGAFVAESPPVIVDRSAAAATVGLLAITPKDFDPLLLDFLIVIQEELADANFGLSLRIGKTETGGDIEPWCRQQAAVIACGGVTGGLLQRLAAVGVPVVCATVPSDGILPAAVSQITVDSAGAVAMMCDLVFGQGHRRVCLVHEGGSAYYDHITQCFFDAAGRAGARDGCDVWHVTNAAAEQRVVERLAQTPTPPTALIVIGDDKACRIINRLQSSGRRVPEDISVIAYSAGHPQRITVPDLSCARVDSAQVFCRAVQVAVAARKTPQICRIEIASRLVIGRTCQPPVSTVR